MNKKVRIVFMASDISYLDRQKSDHKVAQKKEAALKRDSLL
jgi:hypothetical protein